MSEKIIENDENQEESDSDDEEIELEPPLIELRSTVEQQRQRQAVLDVMLEKSKKYRQLQQDRLEHARLAEENAIKAKENLLKEEEVFNFTGNQFYDMLCKTHYVRCNPEEDGCTPNFIVSAQPSHKAGEMMVYTTEGRLAIRPANHCNYSLSMPLIGITHTEKLVKQSRKGGPLKNVNRLKAGRNSQDFQLGKTTMRNVRGRQVKFPFKAPQKIAKFPKNAEPYVPDFSDEDEEIVYLAKKKRITTIEPIKLKRSGRNKNAQIHPKKR